jgi:hypothetical protein
LISKAGRRAFPKCSLPTVSSFKGLWAAIAVVIYTFNPTECANYFAAAGYDAF